MEGAKFRNPSGLRYYKTKRAFRIRRGKKGKRKEKKGKSLFGESTFLGKPYLWWASWTIPMSSGSEQKLSSFTPLDGNENWV